MNAIIWETLSDDEKGVVLARPASRQDESISSFVEKTFSEVRSEGDVAVHRWALHLDGATPESIVLNQAVQDEAEKQLSEVEREAIKIAYTNIYTFHEAEPRTDYEVETIQGVLCGRVTRPLNKAGLYIPGGTAPLFSSLLMLAIPAQLAGVSELVLCTPPDKNGEIHPAILYAACLCGIESIIKLGGAQAIAAMSFGTQTIPKVDIIAGPGNAYVSAAKEYALNLKNGPIIDMPAGPSELMVVADETANPEIIAADLLSQAEHDPDAQVIFATNDTTLIGRVTTCLENQVLNLPRREIAEAALSNLKTILYQTKKEAIEIANQYAAEHLSLNVKDAEEWIVSINTAGTIFVGGWAAESFGDYISGPSHVLPTDGAARNWSGVSVSTFTRTMTVQRITQQAAEKLAPMAASMARLEGLEAHAIAAEIRMSNGERKIS